MEDVFYGQLGTTGEKRNAPLFFTLKKARIKRCDHVGDICFLLDSKQCNLRCSTIVLRYVTGHQAKRIM